MFKNIDPNSCKIGTEKNASMNLSLYVLNRHAAFSASVLASIRGRNMLPSSSFSRSSKNNERICHPQFLKSSNGCFLVYREALSLGNTVQALIIARTVVMRTYSFLGRWLLGPNLANYENRPVPEISLTGRLLLRRERE